MVYIPVLFGISHLDQAEPSVRDCSNIYCLYLQNAFLECSTNSSKAHSPCKKPVVLLNDAIVQERPPI